MVHSKLSTSHHMEPVTLQINKGFKVNGQCLKVYLELNNHENEEVDVIKFVQLC